MSSIEIDSSQWPFVHVKVTGKQSDADVDYYIETWTELLERDEEHLVFNEVVDYRYSAKQLKRVAKWKLQNSEAISRTAVASLCVAPSEAFRFLMSSFLLLAPVPCLFEVFSDREKAVARLHEVCDSCGFEKPAIPPAPEKTGS